MTLEINNVIIGGNLTRDVVIKDTVGGHKVCTFTVANNRSYTHNNRKVKETSFIDTEVWGIIAENCSLYLKKGSAVVVTGRLKQSRWETADGEKRSRLKVLAQNVQFLTPRRRKSDAGETPDEAIDEVTPAPESPSDEAGSEDNFVSSRQHAPNTD